MTEKKKGLRQRILAAETVSQIHTLLEEGKTFSNAMTKTKRSWKNAAARRIAELKG